MQVRKASMDDDEALSSMNVHVQRLHADAYPALFKQPEDDGFAIPFFNALLKDPEIVIYIAEEKVPLGYVVLRIMHRIENAFMHAWNYIYRICGLKAPGFEP